MFVYDNIFKNDDEIRSFIENAETNYKNQVLKIANDISNFDHIQFLTLAGPSCAGKTTTSYILEHEFESRGMTVKIISIDDFYRDRSDISDDETPDYESISAIDFAIFEDCVNKIKNGETAMLPIFDFKIGGRKGFVPYTPAENEIVIFEGIQAIYPEIIATLPKEVSKSIYISVDDDVMAYGTHFKKREIRFYRRLVRDFLFRNASPSRTLELWDGVVKNEDLNIIPNAQKADYIINSFLSYELGVIKPYLLNKVIFNRDIQEEMNLYQMITAKFQNVPAIPANFVPIDSVFREFIGK